MTPRRPSRSHCRDKRLMIAQRLRLEGIARGEIAPRSLWESCFQGMIRAGGSLPMRDFVVSPILFVLENQEAKSDPVDTP